jgi:hypothetical protein
MCATVPPDGGAPTAFETAFEAGELEAIFVFEPAVFVEMRWFVGSVLEPLEMPSMMCW